MTNSRLTDPEVLEMRFPVLLEDFHIRRARDETPNAAGTGSALPLAGEGGTTRQRRVGRGALTQSSSTPSPDLRLTPKATLSHKGRGRLSGGSGGRGKFSAGNGTIRTLRFLEKMDCAILSSHRTIRPHGLLGGEPGELGATWVRRNDGARRARRLRPDGARARRGGHRADADRRRLRQSLTRINPDPRGAVAPPQFLRTIFVRASWTRCAFDSLGRYPTRMDTKQRRPSMSNASRCRARAARYASLATTTEKGEARRGYETLASLWREITPLADRFDRLSDESAKARIYELMQSVEQARHRLA